MASVNDNIKAAEIFIDAINKQDVQLLGSVCTDDVVAIEMVEPDNPFSGRDAVVESYRELFESYPDCKCKINIRIADEKGVLFEVIWTGTNEKPFRGDPATGKFLELHIAYIFIMESGKIQHIHEYYDLGEYETQMGMR